MGPNYKTGWEDGSPEGASALQAFQTLSLILMASRLILACQYGACYWWLSGYRKARLPILAHIGTLFIAAMIYLGLFFSFGSAVSDSGLIAWYVTIGFEAAVTMLVSARTYFMSLRRTAIVERLGLLTLIILGEGIIGLCASVGKIGGDGIFTSDVIGMVISSVCIIYFIWMLYFDQEETNHVGTIRQQFWTLLHFPFHICVLLTVEGLNRFSVWVKLIDTVTPLETVLSNLSPSGLFNEAAPTGENLTQTVELLNETVAGLLEKFEGSQFNPPNITYYLETMEQSNGSSSDYWYGVFELTSAGFTWVSDNLGIEPPEASNTGDPLLALVGIFDLFQTVFIYFFIAAGLCLIFLAVLFWVGKRRKLRGEILSIGVRLLIGLGLCLLSLMDLPVYQANDNSPINTYLYTPWLLPTVVISYAIVVLVDNLLINYVRAVVFKKKGIDHAV